jgi:hypothetical protein
MRWVVELALASLVIAIAASICAYTTPSSLAVQAGERGRFAGLSLLAIRLASSPDFLFRLQEDAAAALEQASAEARQIDPLASVSVSRPAGGACPAETAARFSVALATVLPNGTAVCVIMRA